MRSAIIILTNLRARAVMLLLLLVAFLSEAVNAQSTNSLVDRPRKALAAVLPPSKLLELEKAVDRGLAYLASEQEKEGTFPTIPSGQPGVTSLAVMAFLSRGHQPGHGTFGEQLNRAIDAALGCQRADGLLSKEAAGPTWQRYEASHTAVYNHGITGLMLGEVYGQVTGARMKAVKQAMGKALQFTRELQVIRKSSSADVGAWRYLRNNIGPESDLSVTAWQLMFMRSAKNAEFPVPQGYVDEAMAYVHRCFDPQTGMFHYGLSGGGFAASRGMAGAGILSLSMAGQHQTPMAKAAGDWLLAHPYRRFGEVIGTYDKFFYSTYYCSQGMAQLGGQYWEKFFPAMAEVLLKSQLADGSWPPEQAVETSEVAVFGKALTTAFAVLSLTTPYQLLPVYQR